MATGPGDELEAAGRGHLRASHADRELVIETLKAAFAQGRLARDEFDLRVDRAFAARTYADLADLTTDLPIGLAAARPSQPVRAREAARVRRPGAVLAMATVLYISVWPVAAFLVPKDGEGEPRGGLELVAVATLVYLVVLATRGMDLLFSWQDKRSAGQLPPGPAPGAGAQESPRPSSADRGRLPPAGPGRRPAAEAAPVVRPRLLPGWQGSW